MDKPTHAQGVARAVGQSIAGDLGARFAVLVTSLIAARSLSPAGFGEFLAWLASALVAAILWDVGVSVLVQREVAAGRIAERAALSRGLVLRLMALPLWTAMFALGVLVIQTGYVVDLWTTSLFAGVSLVAGLRLLPAAVLRANFRFLADGTTLAAGRWVTAGLALAALSVSGDVDQLRVLAGAALAGEVVALAGAAILLRRRSRRPARRSDSPELISFGRSWPLAVNSAMVQFYNRLDIILVAALTSATQVGEYAPASRMQDAMYLLPGALGAVGLTVVARVWSQGAGTESVRRLVGRLLGIGLTIAVPVALLVTLFAPFIVRSLLGTAYLDSVLAVRILAWSIVASAFIAPLIAALVAVGRALDATKVYGATFAGALVLHLSLDWWAGSTGAAVASLCRDVAGAAAAYALARRAGLLPQWLTLRRNNRRDVVERENLGHSGS